MAAASCLCAKTSMWDGIEMKIKEEGRGTRTCVSTDRTGEMGVYWTGESVVTKRIPGHAA